MITLLLIAMATAASTPPSCQRDSSDGWVESTDPAIAADQCFPSPDGRYLVRVNTGRITVTTPRGTFNTGTMDGGRILWSPGSRGFVVADSQGSGQSEVFRFIDVTRARPHTTLSLRRAAVARFKSAYRCHGAGAYANTITAGWTADGRVRLVVQNGVHSQGCDIDDDNMIGLVGDPLTGRITRQLTPDRIRREWCTPAQRAAYGYCYEPAAFAAAHPGQP